MFQPLNLLEKLLVAATTDPEQRTAFTSALLQSPLFYSPQGEPPKDGSLGTIAVAAIGNEPPAAALFSARERLIEAMGRDVRIASMKGYDLLLHVRGGPVRLNPNLEYSVIWPAGDVEEIIARAHLLMPLPQLSATYEITDKE